MKTAALCSPGGRSISRTTEIILKTFDFEKFRMFYKTDQKRLGIA
jgi:hypothetical protein